MGLRQHGLSIVSQRRGNPKVCSTDEVESQQVFEAIPNRSNNVSRNGKLEALGTDL